MTTNFEIPDAAVEAAVEALGMSQRYKCHSEAMCDAIAAALPIILGDTVAFTTQSNGVPTWGFMPIREFDRAKGIGQLREGHDWMFLYAPKPSKEGE